MIRRECYDDAWMRENNIDEIIKRVKNTFSNRIYIRNLGTSEKNWLDVEQNVVLEGIIEFLNKMSVLLWHLKKLSRKALKGIIKGNEAKP